MREHSILFKAEMVNAILDGRKVATRGGGCTGLRCYEQASQLVPEVRRRVLRMVFKGDYVK